MFKYKIIDDFFEKKDFLKLKAVVDNKEKLSALTNDNYIKIDLDDEHEKDLIKRYQDKLFEYLNELNPIKKNFVDYSTVSIGVCGKDYKYPIHTDSLRKVITAVIYLSPEKNSGTFIYDSKKENPKEIEWKINRAFIFSRKEKSTHHSFGGDGINHRCVINFNLETKKIDKAEILDRGIIIFIINKVKSFLSKK